MVVPDPPRRKTTSRAWRPLPFGTKFRHEGEPAVAHPALVQGLLELGLAGKGDVPGGGRPAGGGEGLLLRGGAAGAGAGGGGGLPEPGLAGKGDVPGGGRLDEGGEVLLLRGGDADGVEVALLLALEEPDAPGKGDEDAAGLGAGDLTLPPVHRERRLRIDVPDRPFQADGVLAAGAGGILHALVGGAVDPLGDAALARGR